jgi:hypothetical protein
LGLLPFQVCTRIISMENQSFDNNISAQVVWIHESQSKA